MYDDVYVRDHEVISGQETGGFTLVKAFFGDGPPLTLSGASASLYGLAEKGCLFIDMVTPNIYINVNTKAQPNWKLITRAA